LDPRPIRARPGPGAPAGVAMGPGGGPAGRVRAATSRAAGAAPGGPGEAVRPHGAGPRPGRTPPGDPRRGVWVHPHPHLLGPRSGAARPDDPQSGRPRPPAPGDGPGPAGPGDDPAQTLGPALGRVPRRRRGRARPAHRAGPTAPDPPRLDPGRLGPWSLVRFAD